jgi:hypothetical protein
MFTATVWDKCESCLEWSSRRFAVVALVGGFMFVVMSWSGVRLSLCTGRPGIGADHNWKMTRRLIVVIRLVVKEQLRAHRRFGNGPWRLVLALQRCVVRTQLAVVQTTVTAYLDLTLDMHAQRVWEFECVKESVRDNSGSFIGRSGLQEPADHLGPQDAALFVRQLDHVTPAIRSRAGLHSHVELSWNTREIELRQKWTLLEQKSLVTFHFISSSITLLVRWL